MTTRSVVSEEKNPRGIPRAPFIDDVEKYVGGPDGDTEGALKAFGDAISKYRYMESNLGQRRRGLEDKIPDFRKTLDMVEVLGGRGDAKGDEADGDEEDEGEDEKKPLRTTFELNETLYAEAELEDTDIVYLWLGANVMLSYPIPDAIHLLTSKLQAAEKALDDTVEDLEFLREQVTVMEVNTARVYNWDVKRRRGRREREEGKEGRQGST